MLKRLIREPLVHFLLLGGMLFLWWAWQGGAGGGSNRIAITRGVADQQITGFVRTWGRAPSDTELKALIDDHVKEQIAAREAVAMGLDRDDTIITRRLRQKLEFLLVDEAAAAPASDAELRAWLDRHPEVFRVEPQLAFRQVYIRPDRRGAAARVQAHALLAKLRAAGPAADISRMGDATMLPADFAMAPQAEVERAFGRDFADDLMRLAPGQWSGPVESTYGLHLVLVQQRTSGAQAELDKVRPLVEREVQAERRTAAVQALYDRLLAKYVVTIEKPSLKAAATAPAASGMVAGAP
jgi:hypothetical protein